MLLDRYNVCYLMFLGLGKLVLCWSVLGCFNCGYFLGYFYVLGSLWWSRMVSYYLVGVIVSWLGLVCFYCVGFVRWLFGYK